MDGPPSTLREQAVELLVKRVESRFDDGEATLSRALATTTVPQTIATDQYTNQSDTGFSFESMVKLYLYKQIKQFSDSELERRLANWEYLQYRFNIDRVPTQQTLSYTWHNRFSDEAHTTLNTAAKEIAVSAANADIITEEIAPDTPDDSELTDDGTPTQEHKREKAQQSVRLARKHVHPHFKTGRADNKQYSDEAIFDMLSRMCATLGSANSEGEYAWLTDDDYTAHGSTILRAMKKIGSPEGGTQLTIQDFYDTDVMQKVHDIRDAVNEPFNKATDNIISSINGDTPFDDRQNIAAIDITYLPIYTSPWEDKDAGIANDAFPMMASGYKNSEDEFARGFKFATVTLVGENVPIILGIEPMKNNSKWEPDDSPSTSKADIVSRLLDRAEQFVDLDVVLFDRGFYVHKVFNDVAERGITYITPKKEYVDDYSAIENIQEHPSADAAVEPDVVSSDGDREHELNFVYVPSSDDEDGEYTIFATNKDTVEPDEIASVTNMYRRRWDIENQYKSIKDFLPRTSSMDFRVRFLNFVFGTLMYNLWRLTDYLIKRALNIDIRAEPVFGARTFARAVGNYLREID